MGREMKLYKGYSVTMSQPYPTAKVKAIIADGNGRPVRGIKAYSTTIAFKIAKHVIDKFKKPQDG